MCDQLHLNNGPANAIAAALCYNELTGGRPDVVSPSRLFIYDNEGVLSGGVGTSSPVALRDGCWTIPKVGACPEAMPWDFRTMRRVS